MKKVKTFTGLVVLLIVSIIVLAMCTVKIPNGYVGVKYSVNGGVQDDVLTQGWHITPPSIKVTRYSIATEQLYMSKDAREGSKEDDSFNVVCSDGTMNVDIEMSYHYATEDVISVFKKYRGMSGEDVMNNIVRGKIKTKISEVTSRYSVLDAYMEKKSELNADITEALQTYLKQFGVVVESCNITEARVDDSIATAITERSRVAQELEVEKMNQEKAELQAKTKLIQAEGDNAVKIANAKAEAEAYNLKSKSLTKELLQSAWIAKWDGKLPTVAAGDTTTIMDIESLME